MLRLIQPWGQQTSPSWHLNICKYEEEVNVFSTVAPLLWRGNTGKKTFILLYRTGTERIENHFASMWPEPSSKFLLLSNVPNFTLTSLFSTTSSSIKNLFWTNEGSHGDKSSQENTDTRYTEVGAWWTLSSYFWNYSQNQIQIHVHHCS